MSANGSDAVAHVIEGWRNRLMDLTFRNPLLEMKPKSLAVISAPDPMRVWKALAAGRELALPRWVGPLAPAPEGDPAEGAFAEEAGDLELALTGRERDRLIQRLSEQDRTSMEEQGVPILHVAVGTLEWREAQGLQAVHRSPLLLLPATLQRKSALEPFRLSLRDEDPVANPALHERLVADFQLALPPLDEESPDPEAYLAAVEKLVQPLGWAVAPSSAIGRFGFAKLVMYREMLERAADYEAHPFLAALAGGTAVQDAPAIPDPLPEDLDALPVDALHEVLEADSSQVVAMWHALNGGHLVIEGPPGTGKSQTIANIIATALGQGQSVLFVSEKAAALEVVERRLAAVGLSDFCLSIHGKPDRGAIVRDLARALNGELPPPAPSDRVPEEYQAVRQELSSYVAALHQPAGAGRWTPYEIYGRLAPLHDAPRLPFPVPEPLQWTERRLRPVRQGMAQLAEYRAVVEAGSHHPWYGYQGPGVSLLAEREDRAADLLQIRRGLEDVQAAAAALAQVLHLDAPATLAGVEDLAALAAAARTAPVREGAWFAPEVLDARAEEALARGAAAERYWDDSRRLEPLYPADQRPRRDALAAIRADLASAEAAHAAHPDLSTAVVPALRQHQAAGVVLAALAALDALGGSLEELGLPRPQVPSDIGRTVRLVEILLEGPMAHPAWLSGERARAAERAAAAAERRAQELAALHRQLDSEAPGWRRLSAEDLMATLAPFRSPVARWVRARSWSTAQDALAKTLGAPASWDALGRLADALAAEARLQWADAERASLQQEMGRHYQGDETDWGRAHRAAALTLEFVQRLGADPSPALAAALTEPVLPTSTRRTLAQALAAWRQVAANLPALPFAGHLSDIRAQAAAYVAAGERPLAAAAQLLAARTSGSVGWAALCEEAAQLEAIRRLEEALDQEAPALRERFGAFCAGMRTDWERVGRAIEWCRWAQALPGVTLTPAFQALAVAGVPPAAAPALDRTEAAREALQTALDRFQALFSDPGSAPMASVVRSWPFGQGLAFLAERMDHLSELEDWTAVAAVCRGLEEAGFAEWVAELWRTAGPGSVARMQEGFWRRFYQEWLDAVARERPVLARFRRQEHMDRVRQFRALDRELCHWHRERLRHQLYARRPRDLVQAASAETSIVLREAQKRRRFMPLRKLIGQVSHLLPEIKPCLLMSPLAVSTLLDLDLYRFDLVIFDEASQVRPEDAAGAILRARQAIVVGDQHQLPPTDFFTDRAVGAADDPEDEAGLLSFDSLLDLSRVSQVARARLRWHYRSRHESLIAFSNHDVYEGGLVTFPSAVDQAPYRGVEYVRVADGLYGRGGTRANQPEAARVAQLVVEHVERRRRQSLGVVTFSAAQMEAIQDELERRTREDPALALWLGSDSPVALFVKNLERVQGDERDVMILSTGYGRDASGRLHFQFGPLALDGGYRRLNVAITRARDHVKVVSSLAPEDLAQRESLSRGVAMLQRYLDYAQHGPAALGLARGAGEADTFESPLEESVHGALRALGWSVRTQVGVGRYRIDLGVVHPDDPGRFLLGVECDGAQYHGTPTARERDRLRQEVLEGLGWHIARVWAPDWIKNRAAVIAQLEQAYQEALAAPLDDAADLPDGAAVEDDISDEAALPAPKVPVAPESAPPAPMLAEYPEDAGGQADQVVRREAPVHVDVVARRLYGRTSDRRRREVLEFLHCTMRGELESRTYGDDQFLYVAGSPIRARALSDRELSQVAPEELAQVVLLVLQSAYSLSRDDLVQSVARVYGLQRTGARVRAAVERTLQLGVAAGMWAEEGGRIAATGVTPAAGTH